MFIFNLKNFDIKAGDHLTRVLGEHSLPIFDESRLQGCYCHKTDMVQKAVKALYSS